MANVLDVRGALPQIFVTQALVGSSRRLVGALPGEGSILMRIPDRLLGGFQEFWIFENKRLRPEDFRLFFSERLSERRFVSGQFDFSSLDGPPELFPLLSCITNLVNGDLGVHEFPKEKCSNGDARRNGHRTGGRGMFNRDLNSRFSRIRKFERLSQARLDSALEPGQGALSVWPSGGELDLMTLKNLDARRVRSYSWPRQVPCRLSDCAPGFRSQIWLPGE